MAHPPLIGQILSRHNAGYHADGSVKRGRQIVADYYVVDELTSQCMEDVLKHYPHASTGVLKSKYAPEQRKPCVILPTQAELKRCSLELKPSNPSPSL